MKRTSMVLLSVLLVTAMLLGACGAEPTPTTPPPQPTKAPVQPTTPPKEPPLGLPAPLDGMTWDDVLAAARGQTVNWWMWGGSDPINTWVNGWLAEQLKERYDITMNQVPVAGPTEFINQVLGEKQAGVNTGGAVDIMWINGENFRTMKEADLLYGPWSEIVPSGALYDWDDAAIAYDFGYPVDGYEIPWSGAQVVIEYDSAKMPTPPKDMAALVQWIKDNPGLFTYPAPPDFTGSVWVRMMCYYATGGYEQFLGPFDQALFDEKFPACWELLNELEPYLWREGATYPENQAAHIDLFANGEVSLRMTYGPGDAQTRINNGQYRDTVRTYVLEDGTIANTNYIAIAYNAANLPAALVTANFLASFDSQYSTIVTLNRYSIMKNDALTKEQQDLLASVERGPAILPPEVLGAHKLPELQSSWLTAIEEGWKTNVLQK